jgi:DNA-binding transcriptional MerR regulator
MKNNFVFFTSGEFAKLHHLNKRTLHYYDNIGLFSPKYKGENGYRYYTYEQSLELENILTLRELGMSIEEIKEYIQNPSSEYFHKIAAYKVNEINKTIDRLKTLKLHLQQKEKMLNLSDAVFDGKIELIDLDEEYLLMTPLSLIFENDDNLIQNSEPIMKHLQAAREICTYKKNCGSFLSVEKIQNGKYDEYDGIFTVVNKKKENLYIKPKGRYIRGFSVGNWDKIPSLYKEILLFAEKHHLKLTGYAFEMGINEFAISDMNDYVTQIEIQYEA